MKEPGKRASAAELSYHPFILRYSEADGDMIYWLKEYQEI
jgi:hypothetical protein